MARRACISGITGSRSIACQVAPLNRWPYRSIVIVAVEWPMIACTAFTSAPAAMSSDAAVCRRSWIVVPTTPTRRVASASAAKRRLLARIVKAAVLDDAKIDESALIVGVLRQIDTPHIRCLEAIYRAEQEAKAGGDLQPTARGAEKELTQQVRAVDDSYPLSLLTQLEHLGLIDGSITWDGVTLVTGTTVFGAQVLEDSHSISE